MPTGWSGGPTAPCTRQNETSRRRRGLGSSPSEPSRAGNLQAPRPDALYGLWRFRSVCGADLVDRSAPCGEDAEREVLPACTHPVAMNASATLSVLALVAG